MEEFKNSQKYVNQILQKEIVDLSKTNQPLKEMLEYSLQGGKRIRPVISLVIAESIFKRDMVKELTDIIDIEKETNYLINIIVFLEFMHSASLILDDLPCMDNDDFRRGNPTFHKKYGVKKAYLLSNFMIGKSCSKIVKLINQNERFNKSLKTFLIKEIFDNNLLTSLGQIKDLDPTDDRDSIFINKVTKKILGNKFTQNLVEKFDLTNIKIRQLIWLNMKTFPLFYLSFLLPNLLFLKIDDLNDTLVKEKLDLVLHISFCFSIMFQICDDLEDWDKDSQVDKVNSHLKIINENTIKSVYLECKKEYLNVIEILEINKSNKTVLNCFVEILDKKIEIYDNGKNKK